MNLYIKCIAVNFLINKIPNVEESFFNIKSHLTLKSLYYIFRNFQPLFILTLHKKLMINY